MVSVNLNILSRDVPLHKRIEHRNEMRAWLAMNVGPRGVTPYGQDLHNSGAGWHIRCDHEVTPITWYADIDDEQLALMFKLCFS